MTTRSLLLAFALATSSAAFGQTLERTTTAATRETPAREQTLLVELVNGMRELIVRDVNRFWITFGHALREG